MGPGWPVAQPVLTVLDVKFIFWRNTLPHLVPPLSPAHPSLLPPRFHPHSSPDDSDVETPERNTVFSPEMVEVADNEERKADARKRRE